MLKLNWGLASLAGRALMAFGKEMDLSGLLTLLKNTSTGRRLLAAVRDGSSDKVAVMEAARAYLLAAVCREAGRPALFITSRPEDARRYEEQLLGWYPRARVMVYPEADVLPYERIASGTVASQERLRVLAALTAGNRTGEPSGYPVVVTSVGAFLTKTIDREMFEPAHYVLKTGMVREPLQLLGELETIGYHRETIVEIPGAISHRGGIIDVFPVTSDRPLRIEFFGDTIDSIRFFDPESQRSRDFVASVEIGPAAEFIASRRLPRDQVASILRSLDLANCTEETKDRFQRDITLLLEGQRLPEAPFYAPLFNHGSLADYLPENALMVLDDLSLLEQAAEELEAEGEQMRAEKIGRGELPGNFPRPYFTWQETLPRLAGRQRLEMTAWDIEGEPDFHAVPGYAGRLPAFLKEVATLAARGRRVIIVSHQAERLAELLDEEGIVVAPTAAVTGEPPAGSVLLLQGSLPEGWVMDGQTHLFTDAEIFGFVKQRRQEPRPLPRRKIQVDFKPGDYLVHVEHGIGRFKGLTKLVTAGSEKEYLEIEYAAGDCLYVPTDQFDRVGRYIGAGDAAPALSRLGTQEWHRTKQRAKEAATLLARDLLELYAAREVVPGFAFSPDSPWQQELESAFPYVETPDQLEAIREVKADMERPRPMDRLVCGDVGYGKTEIAIRAAFKAVMDGRQVAVLVPTTVLAQQHFVTFSERLAAFPVKVEMLSRFRTEREQRDVLAGLAAGTVDICIGTHRLLQKDVVFKDLGLLIIDEEQRFGVNHKEHFKKLRREVDVLTLSATPIPRTLHMSLIGVRDMSIMETPPEARLPIRTYVAEYNDHLVRGAILRELERGGQVFFVHNRVQSIGMVAAGLQRLVPEARIAIGHGQMPEDELARVMDDFGHGRVDVLVSTTIIESGLDMPNANTIIVNHADRFGLTQLYQLRGRVGRGANLAYAYFLYDGGRRLTPVAQKRLQTIYEATELGAGYTIAMKDLEIRGAGTILGTRQSGHITAVGFSLYTRLLAEAVEEQKARREGREVPPPRLPAPSIDLPLDAFIPESYVPDLETRLELYRSLTGVTSISRLEEVGEEYRDRFGPLPPEVENLLYIIRIKIMAAAAGIESVAVDGANIVLQRFAGLSFDMNRLLPGLVDGVEVSRVQVKINYRKLAGRWRKVLEDIIKRV